MKLKIVSLLTLSVGLPTAVFGLGIRLPDQDAFATGRGEAFVATADNPSAIYYNPAGITQLEGQNARAGFYGIYLNDHYNGQGLSLDTKDSIQVAPQLYYTYGFKDVPLTLGLGLYAPYGLAVEWPDNAPFTGIGKKGSLSYLTLNPVIAYKVLPTLSIAAGATLNYGNLNLRQQFGPGAELNFRGDGFTPGFNAGVLWQPVEKWSFGANYRSETRINFSGDTSFTPLGTTGSTANVPFPQYVVGGVSFRPTPKWNFEVDADWTDWHAFKTVTVSTTPIGPATQQFHWESSFFYEFGVTYYFENDWHLSGGYIYSENSVPDGTFNPVVPDSDRHIWSVGVGSKWKKLSWDATYQLAWGPTRTINPNGAPPPFANGGTYEFLSHAISVSVGYHF